MAKSHILIISPGLAKANNGNWQTAARWSRFLREKYQVTCVAPVAGLADTFRPDAIIALHARRSAIALAELSQRFPMMPSILLLTGTDLYRDINTDDDAAHSLALATRLVVLQAAGIAELPDAYRSKTCVIHQSARSLTPDPARRGFHVIMIGHLRAEKDPATFLHACALLQQEPITFTHIGGALEPGLAALAERTARSTAGHYRWIGNQPHAATRQRLKRSHLMVISSIMEGGANVIIEAITSGVAVIASDISGNIGMLGDDYLGYFPVGDAAALAALIGRTARDPAFLARLQQQCDARRALFTPERERAAVLQLVDNCLQISGSAPRRPPPNHLSQGSP
ncbi:selenoneine biosynthesis selenosugar synthase SenB [Actimicrobium antarcticum]|uniref:Glycosyl transferase family 1 domain-containing protein n=1 Tax=Actimicrobium antarcticum TaxID=1051899 RepID=A0ABP7SNY2_9BURK